MKDGDQNRRMHSMDGWCTEEFDSLSAIPSTAGAVSSSLSSAEETKAILSVDSNNSSSLLQNENSDFPVISLDETNDDIQVMSQKNWSFLEEKAVWGTTSLKPIAKKSTSPSPRPQPLILRKNSKDKIHRNLKQSLIQVKSQLGAISSKNDNIQQVSHGALETFTPNNEKPDNVSELTKHQLNGERTDELCDTSLICKILSVSSMAESNQNDVTSTKSLSCKSKDIQLKKNKTSTIESNVLINEEIADIFDDFGIRQEHGKSLGVSIGGQENNCFSESNEKTSLPTVQTLKENDDIDVIDIDELLIEPLTEDNMLEEFIDVEVMPIEIDDRKGETNEVIPKVHEDKTNKQSMVTNETFQKTRSEFSSPKLDQSSESLSGKANYHFLHNPVNKNNSHRLNKPIHRNSIEKLKKRTKENKKKSRRYKSLLKIAAPADSSSTLPKSPKSLSSTVKSSLTVNSNSGYKDNQDLKRTQIFEKISRVKNLTPSTLLDHLTEDDIRTLGGEVFEEEQPLGFARGLEPESILGVHIEENRSCFIIKWVGGSLADIVTAEEATIHCPQLVIAFYEKQYRKTFLH